MTTTSPRHAAPPPRASRVEHASSATHRRMRFVLEALAIYVIYTALSELNREFTPPPTGISPIWLPAGFAVGVTLVRGMWTAIPLFLTGVINTMRADLHLTEPVTQGGTGMPMETLAWAAVLYGVAVAGHGVLAKLLVDRFVPDREYDGLWSATAFLLFVGPVSCLLSGPLGAEVFRAEGFVDDDAYVVSAFTFWIGDSVACMVLAPIFVAVAGGAAWRTRRTAIIMLALLTMVIVIVSTSLVGRTELDRIRQSYERSTNQASDAFESRVLDAESIALDVATLFTASEQVTEDEFELAAASQLARSSDVDLVAFVSTPDARVEDATVTYSNGTGSDDLRASFIPDPALEHLEEARNAGTTVWVPEVDDPGAVHDFVYAPVYRGNVVATQLSPARRRSELIGFVAARTDLARLLAESTEGVIDRSSSAVVSDERQPDPVVLAATARGESNPLVESDASTPAAARTEGVPFSSRRTVGIGDTDWSVTFAPSREFVSDRAFLVTILPSSLIALALTLTIGVLALTSSGQRARLARLVALRTRELLASERRYRSVVDNVREAVFQLTPDDRVTFVSAAWNELLHDTEHDVVGERLVDVLPVAEPRRLSDLLDMARAEPGATMRGEFAAKDHGIVLEIRVASPKVDPDGALDEESAPNVGSIVGMIVDMTEQRTVLRNREKFVSMVAHELRNPLTVISGSIATISAYEAQKLPPVASKLLPAVQSSADKLDRIIADLLVSSQVDAGTLTLHPEPTDLRAIVRTAATAAAVSAAERGIVLGDVTEADEIVVECDGPRILQVLDNMLSNAIKYTPAGGSIRVEASTNDEHRQVHVRISDTGIGIAPADRVRIFERYGRAEAGSALAEGTGLGLAICQAIAEAHGGSIELETELGVGSTFTLVLPQD